MELGELPPLVLVPGMRLDVDADGCGAVRTITRDHVIRAAAVDTTGAKGVAVVEFRGPPTPLYPDPYWVYWVEQDAVVPSDTEPYATLGEALLQMADTADNHWP